VEEGEEKNEEDLYEGEKAEKHYAQKVVRE